MALRLLTGLLVACLIAGCGGSGSPPQPAPVATPAATEAPAPPPPATRGYPDLTTVAERASASVVSIAIWKPGRDKPAGGGSGVILDGEGSIVTNHHVIEGASRIQIRSYDRRLYSAEVVGSDARVDLALVRALGDTSKLTPIEVGDSSALRLGEWVLAVGNPYGLGRTVTVGIVSAKGRADVGLLDFEDFIQTDAAINPGNSGGALINGAGLLVGINTAILSRSGGSQGIGFAIPSNVAGRILELFDAHGAFRRGYIGASAQELNPETTESVGVEAGVLIGRVTPGGPADEGGLRTGDIVTAIDDEVVETSGRLRTLIATGGPGRKVVLAVVRSKVKLKLTVELGAAPAGQSEGSGRPKSSITEGNEP